MRQSLLRTWSAATITLVAMTASTAAVAASVTFSFSASVLSSDLGGAPFGSPVTGSFTFESTAPDSDPSAIVGLYETAITEFNFSASIYSAALTSNFVPGIHGVQVFNDDPDVITFGLAGDAYIAFAQADPSQPLATPSGSGLGFVGFSLTLVDPTEQAFTSTALPLTPPDVSQFSFGRLTLVFEPLDQSGPGRQMSAAVNVMSLVAVPEPATVVMLMIGLFGMARVRRRLSSD